MDGIATVTVDITLIRADGTTIAVARDLPVTVPPPAVPPPAEETP